VFTAGARPAPLPLSGSAVTLPPGAATLPPRGGGPATLPPPGPERLAVPADAPAPAATSRPDGPGPATAPGDTGPLVPGQSFGPRYHIKRLLGLGGMGAVYQAWDTELGVDVAIKLIRPEILADPDASAELQRRFKRELLLARLVSHKNVVRIHDLGEIGGIKYITMSYVDGTDLASILAAEPRLPVVRVLKLARQVCDGLVAAHAAGVVHRDLKPANVMVGQGDEALITDFGIARTTSEAAADGDTGTREVLAPAATQIGARYSGMTRVGAMVGTVEYMPPEQARGEPVDQRADVYAFGLMLYDMLAGPVRRAGAPSALAELEARTKGPPPALRIFVSGMPDAFDAVIRRCIQPDPAKRFQSSAELADALARLDDSGRRLPVHRTVSLPRAIAAGLALLLAVGGAWWGLRPKPPPPPKDPVSAIVADFVNKTGDAGFDRTL
jgi:serine/threonine protein kinase